MPTTTTEQIIPAPVLAPLQTAPKEPTEEELERLEDAEDLAIAKERYASMDRSQLVPAGTGRVVGQGSGT